MPAQSKAQQKFMGLVHAIQKGDVPASDASPEARKVAKDMNPDDVKDFASTKLKGLPSHVKNEIAKRLKEYALMKPNHQTQSSAPADSLRTNDEMDVDVNENFPANWLQGRTSDYHTALTMHKRKYDDDTNFDKDISGQPDLDEDLSHNQKEMVMGVLDILKQIKDPQNRKEVALKMIAKFKEEDVNFDYNKFLSSLQEYNSKSLDEVGSKDWHFKAIMKMYDKAGAFTRKKIAAVITRNPNSNRDKIARELRYSDYDEITDYTDSLGIKVEGVNEVSTPRGDEQVIKVLNNIVKTHSAEKIKDQKTGKVIMVDVQSANVVLKVYDALSTTNKTKFINSGLNAMMKVSWDIMGRR